jgi:hypothetical protein
MVGGTRLCAALSALALGGMLAMGGALVGCADLGAPAGTQASSTAVRTPTPTSKLAQAQATHEYPSPAPPPETASAGASTPTQAILRFAGAYINWNADTVAGTMKALAAQSVGQARSAMSLAAAQTAGDYELQQGGIANSGTVQAIAPLLNHREQYVVVTRELTIASNTTAYQGLRPAWHLAIATVVELRGGQWALSGWQPET